MNELSNFHGRKNASDVATGGPRRCVLVLGMHRSGTSALTRVLSLFGATLPARLLGAGVGNETGHWEPEALISYHDRLLAEVGSTWHDWRRLDLSRLGPSRREAAIANLADIIAYDYGDAPLIVLKEPRVCRFASFFMEALRGNGFEVAPVINVRNPLEVIASLEARDGISRADAALLWLRHVLDAERCTRGMPRAVTTYDSLLTDWRVQLAHITNSLDIEFPYSAEEVAPLVDSFLTRELRHHARSFDAVALDPMLRGWINDAFVAMCVLERSTTSSQALADLDDIGRSFDQALPTLTALIEGVRTDGLARLVAVERAAKDRLDAAQRDGRLQIEAAAAREASASELLAAVGKELKEAQHRIVELTELELAATQTLAAVQAELTKKCHELALATERETSARIEVNSLESELAGVRQELAEGSALSKSLHGSLSNATAELAATQSHLAETLARATALEESLRTLKSELLLTERNLSAVTARESEAAAALSQIGAEIAMHGRTHELSITAAPMHLGTALVVESVQAFISGVVDELSGTKMRLEATERRCCELEEQHARAERLSQQLEIQLASLHELKTAEQRSELERERVLQTKMAELEALLKEANDDLTKRKQAIAERDLKLSEAEAGRAAAAAHAIALEGQIEQRAREVEAAWQESKAARAEIERVHQMYRSSTSWKVTAPIRSAKTVPRAIGQFFRVLPTAIRFSGGVLPTARKAARILRRDGATGIIVRYRNLAKPSASRPVAADSLAYVAAAPVALANKKTNRARDQVNPVIVTEPTGAPLQALGGMVAISMLRDEIGILPEFAGHVLSLFDKWICIDHNSTDGTYEYLSGLASSNENISLLSYRSPGYFQSELMTHVVHQHKWCLGADWVFMLDADEFLPFESQNSFKQAMDSHSSHAIIRMYWKNLVPETFDRNGIAGKRFYVPKGTAQHSKVAFQPRLIPVCDYRVAQGNHDLVVGSVPAALLAVGAFDLYHIPLRTFHQLRQKLNDGIASYNAMGGDDNSILGLHWRKIADLLDANALDQSIANHIAFSYGTFDFANGFRMSSHDLVAAGATLTPLNVAHDDGLTREIPDIGVDIEKTIDIRIGVDRIVHTSGMPMNDVFHIKRNGALRSDSKILRAFATGNVTPLPSGDVLGQFIEPSYAPIRHLTPTAWAGHIPFMLATMQLLRPRRFVELGSHWGASFFAACQSVMTYGGDCDCIAIDLWQGDHQAGYYDETVFKNFTWILKENYPDIGRYIRADFNEASLLFEDGSIDLLHIDGLHTYAAVKKDFDTWRAKLSPNGTILFHDTMVRRDDFGVYQFWGEIKSQAHSFNFKHTHGLGVLAFGGAASNPMAFLIDHIRKNALENLFEVHFSRLGKLAEMEALAKYQSSQ